MYSLGKGLKKWWYWKPITNEELYNLEKCLKESLYKKKFINWRKLLIICNLCISSYFLGQFYFKRKNKIQVLHTQYTGRIFRIMNISIKGWTLYQKRLRLKIRIWEILFRNYSFIPKVPFCVQNPVCSYQNPAFNLISSLI